MGVCIHVGSLEIIWIFHDVYCSRSHHCRHHFRHQHMKFVYESARVKDFHWACFIRQRDKSSGPYCRKHARTCGMLTQSERKHRPDSRDPIWSSSTYSYIRLKNTVLPLLGARGFPFDFLCDVDVSWVSNHVILLVRLQISRFIDCRRKWFPQRSWRNPPPSVTRNHAAPEPCHHHHNHHRQSPTTRWTCWTIRLDVLQILLFIIVLWTMSSSKSDPHPHGT